MAKLPLDLAKSLKALKEASAKASEPASLVLAGDQTLVEAAREKFGVGGTVPSVLSLDALSGPVGIAGAGADVLVVLANPENEVQIQAALGNAVAKESVIVAVEEGPGTRNRATSLPNGAVRLSFSDSEAGWDRLFSLCAEVAGDKGVALGRKYPVVRRAAAHRVISRTSMQNVFIAMVFFVPGSDMPAMTLNQARMILNIAAMYGQPVDKERAVELAAMLGLGFAFRGVGRLLVRFIPGVGTIMRMVTAYSATTAVGLAAMAYFEKGAPASTSKVVALAKSLRH